MPENIRVADEVWIAVASLQRNHPWRTDFTIDEIMEQAEAANMTGHWPLRSSVRPHVRLHCVANRPPGPVGHRMLLETQAGRRRPFRPGDPCHPGRATGKQMPNRHEVPARHGELLDWYVAEYVPRPRADTLDPILALRGLGKALRADEAADDYVRRQRSDWQ